jgi:hypothetical protein
MFNKGKACACVLFYFIPFFLIRGDQEGKNQNKQQKNEGNYELLKYPTRRNSGRQHRGT